MSEQNGWPESKQLIRHLLDANNLAHEEIKIKIDAGTVETHKAIVGILDTLKDIKVDLTDMKISDIESRTRIESDINSLKSRVSRMEITIATITTATILWALNQVLGLINIGG